MQKLKMAVEMGLNHLKYGIAAAANPEQRYENVAEFNAGVDAIARAHLPPDEINAYLSQHCKQYDDNTTAF